MLVGGYSVILHGHARSTGDMDIWVRQSAENYAKLKLAFDIFRMPMFDMTEESFLANTSDVFTFGRSPVAIDLITHLKGVDFDEAYPYCMISDIEELQIRVIHMKHLIQAKRAAGRARDIDDINHLTAK